MKPPDVLVVGAGVIGAATAYFLAKEGACVTLIDRRRAPASATASAASAGGVRQQDRLAPELPLAMHSIGLWQTLEEELDADVHYRRCGMTVCIDDERDLPALEARVARERQAGLDIEVARGNDLHAMLPALSPAIIAGSYCPSDGQADPMLTTHAFARAAARLGADVRFGCALTDIKTERGRLRSVITTEGAIACEATVLATGAHTPVLSDRFGLGLKIRAGCIQMMVTEACPPLLAQVLGWTGISLKQMPSGNFLIGGGWPGRGHAERDIADVLPESMAGSAAVTVRLLPALAQVSVLRAWTGNESWGADEMPTIDAMANPEGLFVAAGFSGHGFALAPAVGQNLASWVLRGRKPELLRPFGSARFGVPAQDEGGAS